MKRLSGAALALLLAACETPLPPLPPPGAVTSADQAIAIAMNVCAAASRDPHTHELKSWSAHPDGDRWIAFYRSPYDNDNWYTFVRPAGIDAEIRASDGARLRCQDDIVLPLAR